MKRVFDLLLSLLVIVLLLPFIVVIAALVALKLGRPVFFSQTRPGLNGKPFKMYKFRTMTNDADQQGQLLPDEQRLTSFGKFLRSTSLDELPEIWNVLSGEMSFVGPRPLLMSYLPLYSSHQSRRHEVLPGITGWAQVNGRNALSWEEKFDLDVWYVDNRSLLLDIRILFLTAVNVLRRKDINTGDGKIMPVFTGSDETKHEKK